MAAIRWRGFGLAAALAWIGPAAGMTDEVTPVVVELYTSQGCVACPPADAFFASLADDPRVIALALHVDYWDYLGWNDSFASPAFTQRQKRYARAAGARMIYTPQMVINGGERLEGTHTAEVLAHIARQAGQPPRVRLRVARGKGKVTISAEADPPLEQATLVQLVRYHPAAVVQIEHGENVGQRITYRNIVTDWTTLGEWSGTEPLQVTTPTDGTEPMVVIVQNRGPGPVLAAARLE